MQNINVTSRQTFGGERIGMPMIEYGGYDSFRTPLGLSAHTHRGHELTYVFSGRVHWETEKGTVLTLTGGDMALIQPGVAHHGRLNIIEPATIFWLVVEFSKATRDGNGGFTDRERQEVETALIAAGDMVRSTAGALHEDLRGLHAAVERLHAPYERARLLAAAECRARIVSTIVRAASLAAETVAARPRDTCVAAAVDYVRHNLREPLSVADVARNVGLSVSRLHAVFRQAMGITPNDYMQRLRIDTACTALTTSDAPVTRIALETGFSSSQYFATCFRKYTGMSPGEYRRRARLGPGNRAID